MFDVSCIVLCTQPAGPGVEDGDWPVVVAGYGDHRRYLGERFGSDEGSDGPAGRGERRRG